MTRVNASIFSQMLLWSLFVLPSISLADAGHDAKKAPATMESMDHGKMQMDDQSGATLRGHWMAPEAAAKRRNPVKADNASRTRGQKLFAAHCASCHGAQGSGDGPAGKALNPRPADLASMAGQHSDGDFAWKIAEGRGAMPAWKGKLTEKQIWDVVNYVKVLGNPGKKDSASPAPPGRH